MFIGTCGFGSTGSSAISDYLKEFDDNNVLDRMEFTIAYCVDGLSDLERHLMYPSGRTSEGTAAIIRFRKMMESKSEYLAKKSYLSKKDINKITEEYINQITQLSWMGYQNYSNSLLHHHIGGRVFASRIVPMIEKHSKRKYSNYPFEVLPFSVKPENFYRESRRFINELLVGLKADFSKNIVMDQPFSGPNPQACFPFFEDPFAIVVDRDPRDNYIFAKTKLKGVYTFMPTENVQDFIKYYRALRDNQPYKNDDQRVLRIQFESLVYDYDATTEVIRKKLGLPENNRSKSIFDPALSIANTQTFKRFPQFEDEVKEIERKLPEYLFDFTKYPEPDLSGEMFYGRSPKNR